MMEGSEELEQEEEREEVLPKGSYHRGKDHRKRSEGSANQTALIPCG
jgi:hypothetical protein